MKKLSTLLYILMGSIFGVFLGSSLFRWVHFLKHPQLYVVQSAPWYTSILVNAVFTGILLLILASVLYFIKKKRT